MCDFSYMVYYNGNVKFSFYPWDKTYLIMMYFLKAYWVQFSFLHFCYELNDPTIFLFSIAVLFSGINDYWTCKINQLIFILFIFWKKHVLDRDDLFKVWNNGFIKISMTAFLKKRY